MLPRSNSTARPPAAAPSSSSTSHPIEDIDHPVHGGHAVFHALSGTPARR
jgi:hypothetical protein